MAGIVPLIKVCGVRRVEDIEACAALGVTAVGLNFAPESPRFVGARHDGQAAGDGLEQAQALVAGVKGCIEFAGVFVNPALELLDAAVQAARLSIVQLHGEEDPAFVTRVRERLRPRGVWVWKALRIGSREDLRLLGEYDCDGLVLDARAPGGADGSAARGGTGHSFDWSLLEDAPRSQAWILAGGLKPENVAAAVAAVQPEWVDTASGVESAPGVKDKTKLDAFVRAVRGDARQA